MLNLNLLTMEKVNGRGLMNNVISVFRKLPKELSKFYLPSFEKV